MTQFQNCSNVYVKETTDHTDYLERSSRNPNINWNHEKHDKHEKSTY